MGCSCAQALLVVLILGILAAVMLVVSPANVGLGRGNQQQNLAAKLTAATEENAQLRMQLEKCRKECKDGKVKAFGQAAGVPSKNEKSEEGSSNDAPSKKNKEEVPKNKKKVDEEKNSEKEESTTTAPPKKTKKSDEENSEAETKTPVPPKRKQETEVPVDTAAAGRKKMEKETPPTPEEQKGKQKQKAGAEEEENRSSTADEQRKSAPATSTGKQSDSGDSTTDGDKTPKKKGSDDAPKVVVATEEHKAATGRGRRSDNATATSQQLAPNNTTEKTPSKKEQVGAKEETGEKKGKAESNKALAVNTTTPAATVLPTEGVEKDQQKDVKERPGENANQRFKLTLQQMKRKKTGTSQLEAAKTEATTNLLPIEIKKVKEPLDKKLAPQSVCGTSLAPIDYFHYPGETFMDAGRETASLPTDKMTVHRYEVLYENYFAPLRNTKYKLCEIGLGCGQFNGVGRGYELFTKYTPLVEMHGIEFNKPCQETLRKIGKMSTKEKKKKELAMFNEEDAEYMIKNWVWGDQSSGAVMDELIEKFGPFDMIIDDGSHLPEHMVTTFVKLFVEGLAPGGVFFVEDIMWPANGAYRGAFMDMVATLVSYMHWQFPQERLVETHPFYKVHLWLQRIDCEHAICAFVKRKEMLINSNRARVPPRLDPKYRWPFPKAAEEAK